MKDEDERLAEIEALLRAVAAEDRRRVAEYIASSDRHPETWLREEAEKAAGVNGRRRLYRVVSAAASLVIMAVAGGLLFHQYGGGWAQEQPASAAGNVKMIPAQEKALPVPMPQSVPAALVVAENGVDGVAGVEAVPENGPETFGTCSRALAVDDAQYDSVPETARCNRALIRVQRGSGADMQAAELAELLASESHPYTALCTWFDKPGARKRQLLPDGRVVEYSKGNIVVRRGSRVCVLRTQADTLPEDMRAK